MINQREIPRPISGHKKIPSVSIVGLGKLGFPMTVALAKRGVNVWGVDVNKKTVQQVINGRSPVDETDTQDLLTRHRRRIHATMNLIEAVLATDITFIVVATPTGQGGGFSNRQVVEASRKIGQALRTKSAYHLVVVTCTVMPSTTEQVVKPILERVSGKTCGSDFGLLYNPEFIALGTVVRDLLNPDFILVGECARKAGNIIERFYKRVCENAPPVARMKPVEAEIAKLSLNCYCTAKIAFANMLAEIAERIPGADARVITDAIGLDRRIGRRYLAPGLGFGGPCFPRDNTAFRAFARNLAVNIPIPAAVQETNQRQANRIVEKAHKLLPHGGIIALLGLAYKPFTSVITDSQSMDIATALSDSRHFAVRVFDPMAMENARHMLGRKVIYSKSAQACLHGAQLCIIGVPSPEFCGLKAQFLMKQLKTPAFVIDCWHCLRPKEARQLPGYYSVGVGKES